MPERWLSDRRILRLSDASFRTFATALLWSVSNRTDGLIERDDLALLPRASAEHAEELEAAGLFASCDGGWLLVDFQGTQTSRDELQVLENMRRRDREKKARQRAEAKELSEESPRDSLGDGPGEQSLGTAQARPGKANNDKKESRSRFCSKHPGGTEEPCIACMNARRALDDAAAVEKSKPTVPGVVTQPDCPRHPGYPHPDLPHGCPRCQEEAQRQVAA